ncbi:aspartyl protease family protein 2-like [Rhodamnia argentea]|uniref:Aspartyl protease family protein 2-like n=1 Tax=Rhodamnia argentea TaxID=178133 RepID=A0A8B8PVD0_9MYRT|nr:aspartyl protease family protein 2-like [Rhodamnia argentea]
MASKVSSSLLCFLVIIACFSRSISTIHGHNSLKSNVSTLAGIELPHHMSFNAVSASASSGCSLSSSEEPKDSESTSSFMQALTTEGDEEGDDRDDGEESGEIDSSRASSSRLESEPSQPREPVKLHLKRRPRGGGRGTEPRESAEEFKMWDLSRIHTLHRRVTEKKNQNTLTRLKKDKAMTKQRWPRKVVVDGADPSPAPAPSLEAYAGGLSGRLMATLASGVSQGSGEYFMDVFIGTPPKHFSLILDTGSDLNWIQCVPCYDCFEQNGPHYDPSDSTSFRNISCRDPRCHLVSSPDPPRPCNSDSQTCPYFYWYGDSSNTTGDFALETFTVNLTSPAGKSEYRKVEDVMFGCGHWNRGLFHGAAGLLGLGRGPLSFSSQLRSLYGHSFSYCLVDRNSDTSVSSKLIFGEDRGLLSHPNLNYTSFVGGRDNPADTFYYVQIKSILVGGEILKIPEETWALGSEGSGGTIIDSGTTLSYFADPAYDVIKQAFLDKVKGYPLVQDIEILHPCYNISGVERAEFPEFGILFADGAMWNFPVENYFIPLVPGELVCLAILGTPRSALSIIGNYQQQNFHILYDTKKSRLGYAPTRCAEV